MEISEVENPAAVSELLDHVRAAWSTLGENEPHFSVLTDRKYLAENVNDNLEEFFASGRGDVERLEATLRRNDLVLPDAARVAELGCGVGRVTAWLARSYGAVVGLDVSPHHLRLARQHLELEGIENVDLALLTDFDIAAAAGTYDLFFSQIVLQHNPPPVIDRLLDAAMGGLGPGGVAVFQVPTYWSRYSFDHRRYVDSERTDDGIEMHVLPQRRVFELAEQHGLAVVEVMEDGFTGMRPGERSNTFVLHRSST